MIEIGLILALIVLNGLLSGSEAGIVASRKARLREQAAAGLRGADAALRALESPTGFLSTVQVGITLIGIFSGLVGAAALAPDVERLLEPIVPLGVVTPLSYGVVVLVITYLSLVVGELVPKRLAMEHPEAVLRRAAGPMLMLAAIGSPAVKFLTLSTNLILRPLGIGPSRNERVSEEEVRSMIRMGGVSGVLEDEEISVIERVFAAADRRAGSFMVPRQDVRCVSPKTAVAELRRVARESGDTHIPVSPGSLDELLGVVSVVDLAHMDEQRLEEHRLSDVLVPPLFVPETANALRAIELFRKANAQIAFVTDEHGTIEGMVRLADLLEEILGEVGSGEATPEDPSLARRDDGSLLIDGLLPLADLLEALGKKPSPEFDPSTYHTVGGLVVHHLGSLPGVGDSVDIQGWRFEVVDMDGRRVDKVLASRLGNRDAGKRSAD
ncbi:MAG: hemolysin family protein [Planctomycetota bacterium]|nr:hemolysin family protein [Planctomycetota bacterium]